MQINKAKLDKNIESFLFYFRTKNHYILHKLNIGGKKKIERMNYIFKI